MISKWLTMLAWLIFLVNVELVSLEIMDVKKLSIWIVIGIILTMSYVVASAPKSTSR